MGLRKRFRKDIQVPASSLADIAFLLIIFFMVASMFNTSKGLRFDLPAKNGQPRTVSRNEVIIVLLRDNGDLFVDGQRVGASGLGSLLRQKRERVGLSALLLRVQRGCRYGDFVMVVSRIRGSGFPHFSIKGVD